MENLPATVEDLPPAPVKADPEKEIEFAKQGATVLMNVVKHKGLSRSFGGQKEHLYYEAWSIVARFYGCTIVNESADFIGEPDDHGRRD